VLLSDAITSSFFLLDTVLFLDVISILLLSVYPTITTIITTTTTMTVASIAIAIATITISIIINDR